MKRRLACLATALLLAAPFPAGAADSLTTLEMVGRYSELAAAAEKRLAAQPKNPASVLAPLCHAYSKLKDYRRLFPCLDQLDERVRAGETTIVSDRWDISDSNVTALPGMLRAEALIELGDYAAAAAQAKTALDSVRDEKSFGMWPPQIYRITLLQALGLAYALAGEAEAARAQMQRLRDFSIGFMGWAVLGPMRDIAVARIHVALGEYAQALPYLTKDSAIHKIIYSVNDAAWGFSGEDSIATFIALPRLLLRGKCLLETGDTAGAKADLDAVLRSGRIAEFGELYWIALYERGRIAGMEGHADEALEFYRRAVDEIERQRSTINTEANKIGFVGDKQAAYGRLVALLVAQGRAEDAFAYVERSKSRALVDLLASRTDFGARGVDAATVGEVLAQLDAAEAAARIQDAARAPGAPNATRSLQTARDGIRQVAPELATLVTVSSIPPEETRSLLGEHETLVEYYVEGSELFAFVLSRGGIQAVKLDGSELVKRVQQLRRELQLVHMQSWQATSQALHERLWKPVEGMAGTQQVLLVAHGPLHYLPFAALQGADGKFLVDRYSLRFLPAASILKFLRPPAQKPQAPMLALGNPDLGDPKRDLPFAEAEAREVASLFPDSRVLVRQAASKSNFRKLAAVFPRIHFATHGAFQADEPLKSALYLSRDTESDGLLTVGELYSMSLDADLVTLSACETGLGGIASGDDVVGLTRGFLYAGSRSIVASLWNVEDRATAELMKAFYENLRTMDKREALRQAQIKVRETFPHPYYWAAFQLTGRGD